MARTAFVLGGTGQIGRATAARLAERGFDVTVGARTEPIDRAHRFAQVDRREPGSLEAALGDGVDVLVDVIPMTREDAEQVAKLNAVVGSVVAISSASVYTDAEGHTLDEAKGEDDFPRVPVPIPERQRTVEPSDETYSTRKVAVERTLLAARDLPTSVIRPCAIHGPGATNLRELHFVKRALDGRRVVLLARRGLSRFHTTSVANLADLIRLAAERPRNRVFNCGDPKPPTALEISRAVAAALDHDWSEVLLPGPEQGTVGDHPWNAPRPFVVDMTEAEIELGYRPVTTYERAVESTVRWAVDALRTRELGDLIPRADFVEKLFDYGAEDEYLRALPGSSA